jgi:hypothetical protein
MVDSEIEKLKADTGSTGNAEIDAAKDALATAERELQEAKNHTQRQQEALDERNGEPSTSQKIEEYELYVKVLGGCLAGASVITVGLLL